MARAGPRKIREYSLEFKLTAVRLSGRECVCSLFAGSLGGLRELPSKVRTNRAERCLEDADQGHQR